MTRLGLCSALWVGLIGCTAPGRGPERGAQAPLELAHGLAFVELEAAGGARLLALVDTGANASAIDPRCSRGLPSLGSSAVLGTTGELAAESVRVAGLRLGSRELRELRATRRDLGGLLAPAGRAVDLILGSDAFAGLALTLDFARGRIELTDAPDAPSRWVPMRLDQGIPAIPADLAGHALWLRIDTGASLFDTPDVYVNVPTHVWRALREEDPRLRPSASLQGTGADGRTVELPVAAVANAIVGPLSLARVFVIVQPEAGYFADPAAKGFIGNNFLRKLGRVTLDYATGRLW